MWRRGNTQSKGEIQCQGCPREKTRQFFWLSSARRCCRGMQHWNDEGSNEFHSTTRWLFQHVTLCPQALISFHRFRLRNFEKHLS
mmetsp:Transcript_20558/g.44131  ORF Transcript_20558/g.44131 Transcript_20558/m.44131 type:complete len:85 (-) Transcript_20558:2828-3082(-)